MAVFVLPKWAKFNEIIRQWKLYQEFHAKPQPFTRQSVEDPAKQDAAAYGPWTPWLIQQWLVDVDCEFYDLAPATYRIVRYKPSLVRELGETLTKSIATL
jgi:hypothetical protein